MKNYYKILGIEKSATDDEVKKAYRRLAHQHHPDKTGGDEEKFKEINEAYQVLSDGQKRAQYDRFGTADSMGGGFGGQQWGGFQGGIPPNRGDGFGFNVDPHNMGDLGDIFETFFEGLGVKPRRRTYERGSDLELVEEISLEEAFRGVTKHLKIETFVRCETCKGQGVEAKAGFSTCAACNGQGEIKENRRTFFGSFSQVRACEKCRGTGQVPNKACAACKGAGRVTSKREVSVEILPGIEDGQLIKIKNAGEAGERGTAAGDLYVRIKVRPHSHFERHGADLMVRNELNIVDLLLGKKIEVPTISGGKINVEIPAHFNLKDNLRIGGEGMPRFGSYGRGDLLVNFIVKAPKKLSGKAKKMLEELERTND
ncbi:MAG: molecular chaperone DnaJ [Candidatus Liptonbacteria bacterium RIFCSPLOWO2_01_FULL_52_25]|uniref:Chaperone protein DnaJ n=1 Tax=Candidatus Liptonbacteria bacterium RIFCSPLOWO2_01_FULL_52_25 TaxID=1798650 RepID=A0A1G2CG18_9BACT|nr:MAG: molecular chaperone DnaJ [Candidatus Liptonbacteria bacterium RIFCSPLOWO2_01_FULL_52_25]